MKGSAKWQTREIFKTIEHFGESRHAAKMQATGDLKAAGEPVTRHNIGKETGVHSFKTSNDYQAIVRQAFQHAKAEFKLHDITKLEGKHVQSFLESKIASRSINLQTYQTYASALQKCELALNRYAEMKGSGRSYSFSENIRSTGADARALLEKGGGPRGYDNPRAMIDKIKEPDHKIAARIQYEGGNRIREVGHIREGQLKGLVQHPERGQVGQIELSRANAKGGRVRSVHVSPGAYRELAARIASDPSREFRLTDHDRYRDDLKQASKASGQAGNGSHGLRWNYAQESMDRYQRGGRTYEQSLAKVSNDMGHSRPDITEHYLR